MPVPYQEPMLKETRLIILASICVLTAQIVLIFLNTFWTVLIHFLIIAIINITATTEWSFDNTAIMNYLIRLGVASVGITLTFPILAGISLWYSMTTTLWEAAFGCKEPVYIATSLWFIFKVTFGLFCFLASRVICNILTLFSMCVVRVIDTIMPQLL